LACGRAAERRSEDDVAALQELLERMRTSEREHFADADMAFHAKLAELAGNVPIYEAIAAGAPQAAWERMARTCRQPPGDCSPHARRREQATCDVNQPR
jgi:DNA-binding FadR family transcriptional regulator